MAEEKREGPPDKEVEEILSDLEAILSDLGPGQGHSNFSGAADPSSALAGVEGLSPAAPKQAPVAAPPKSPPQTPRPAAPPPFSPAVAKPAPAPPPAFPAAPPSKPEAAFPPAAPAAPSLKPAPAIAATPAAKPAPVVPPAVPVLKAPLAPELPKPAPVVPLPAPVIAAAPAPKPAPVIPPAAAAAPVAKPPITPSAPKPASALPPPSPAAAAPAPRPAQRGLAPAAALPDIPEPEKLGKDQIRRVAYLYLGKYEAERDALAKLLDQTAQTVPKKPLFLRRVLYQALTEDYDGRELLARVLQSKAVAALGIVDGLSEARLRELSELLGGGGVMFRSVAPLDAAKKSVAIDVVVDVMLLPAEAP